MLPILFMISLPVLFRGVFALARHIDPTIPDVVGAAPKFKSYAAKGAGAGAGFLATPQGQAAATMALGPAGGMLVASPQGQQALARGAKLAKKAEKGDPKARKRIATTKAKAARGDPKAKKELIAIKAGARLDEAMEEAAEEMDEEADDEGDEY